MDELKRARIESIKILLKDLYKRTNELEIELEELTKENK